MLLERGKFSCLNINIWFAAAKCKFIVKNSSFEMMVVFSPIFVADTKINFVHDFVAPLRVLKENQARIYFVIFWFHDI